MLSGSVILSVVTLAAVLGVGVPVVLPLLSERATETADQVAALVVQDARAQRVEVGRRELGEANTQLIARNLPTIADPGNTATGDELVIAATTARVLAILPEGTVGRLRADVREGRIPEVLPSSARVLPAPLDDRVIEVIPDPSPRGVTPAPEQPGDIRRPAPAGGGGAPTGAAPTPTPVTPPAPSRDRGLCLGGFLLCER